MSGKVTNVKVRLIKPINGLTVGNVYEPYAYRNHDMNKNPCPLVIYLKNDRGVEDCVEFINFEEV